MLKDAIEYLIKKGQLTGYALSDKRGREESPKTKSPAKVHESGPSDENRESNKGKCPYIVAITGRNLGKIPFQRDDQEKDH